MAVTGVQKEGQGMTTSPTQIYNEGFSKKNAAGVFGGQYMWGDLSGAAAPVQVDYGGFNTNLQGMGQYDAMGQAAQGRKIDPAVYAMLVANAQGRTPSAAQLQLMSGLQRGQASMQSMAASNPNISPALAQRMAMNAGSQMGLETNQQMAQLRAQEMAQAQGQLSSFVLQQQAMNDALTQFYMQQGFSRAEAELKARTEMSAQQNQADIANIESANQNKGGIMGAVGSLVGSLTGLMGKK